MNEQLQLTINDILSKSMEAFNSGADWLQGEIPEVVSQLLLWNMVSNGIWGLFWIAITITCIANVKYVSRIHEKAKAERNFDTEFNAFILLNMGAMLSLLGVLLFIHYAEEFIKILIAPKLYLLEYAADLVK